MHEDDELDYSCYFGDNEKFVIYILKEAPFLHKNLYISKSADRYRNTYDTVVHLYVGFFIDCRRRQTTLRPGTGGFSR